MDLLHLWNVFFHLSARWQFCTTTQLPSFKLVSTMSKITLKYIHSELSVFIHIGIIVMHHCQPVSHLLQSACEAQYLKAASLSLNKKR